MCTLVLHRRPGHAWPLLVAANRDELRSRPSRPPARHWPDRPHVTAGLDLMAGGSWLGVNEDGLMAAVLNRRGTLGPADGKRSRGELVLDALDHSEAYLAAEALSGLDPRAYRPFNLVVADAADAFWVRHAGDGPVRAFPLAPGTTFLEAGDANDRTMPRTSVFLPLFEDAPLPDPERGDWAAWRALLGKRATPTGDPHDAMCIATGGDYGTVSSTLLAVPPYPTQRPVWLFAQGLPDEAEFVPVEMGAVPGARS